MPTVADVTTAPSSGIASIDAVLDTGPGWNWITPARNVLYYTFDLSDGNPNAASVLSSGTTTFNPAQQAGATAALTYISRVTGIQFVQVATGAAADIHFAQADITDPSFAGYTAWHWNYDTDGNGNVISYTADAYVYLDNVQYVSNNVAPTDGTYGYELLLHELGHALGLKHPFSGGPRLPSDQDNTAHTLMSYTYVGGPRDTYSPDDIAALSWLYGGDGLGGTWGYNSSNGPSATLVSTVVNGSTGADTLRGTAANDIFIAEQGNDSIDGGAGTDTAVYVGPFKSYVLMLSGSTDVASTVRDTSTGANSDGTDTLVNVERLQFSNESVALDLAPTQAAGKALLTMAATLGPAFPTDKTWAGIFLRYFDNGAAIADGTNLLFASGILPALAGGNDNTSIVNFIYTNVYGSAPDAATLANLVAPLNARTTTPAQWMADLAASSANQNHVHLSGYAQSGWEYFA
jgi:hypothetical protein